MPQHYTVTVEGIVQGVGFRPFIYALATDYALNGEVYNTGSSVIIELEGEHEAIHLFLSTVLNEAPPMSRIEHIEIREGVLRGYASFEIAKSKEGVKSTFVPPDISLCEACEAEMRDPANRRYGYFLTNCTNCGPRYSIIRTIPYDRANTSMAVYEMCEACKREYGDVHNRRFHAQPISCHRCGPALQLFDMADRCVASGQEVVEQAASMLAQGKIVALKGLGGFHLICDATSDAAVKTLRDKKNRPHKPLAVMFPDLQILENEAWVNEKEKALLLSAEKPIVLLRKKEASILSVLIAPGISKLGAFLPYTPLQLLLFGRFRKPLVVTSANISGDPIASERQTLQPLTGCVEAVVDFDREIVNRSDDSIVQSVANRTQFLRLSRGFVPYSRKLPYKCTKPVLAVGAHQKSTVSLCFEDKMITSAYLGDLHSLKSIELFETVIENFKTFYEMEPECIVCDAHPHYYSSHWAENQAVELIRVQHHYAHALAVMAEYNLKEKILAFCWDGTGYGDDGTLWGGETLLADISGYERAEHLAPLYIVGSDEVSKEIYKSAYALLRSVYDAKRAKACMPSQRQKNLLLLERAYEQKRHGFWSGSMGRLFDAVAYLGGFLTENGYEGHSGLVLEHFYDESIRGEYGYALTQGKIVLDEFVYGLVQDVTQDAEKRTVATKFIRMLSSIIGDIASRYDGLSIALCGGVFQNQTLCELACKSLSSKGKTVLLQTSTPPNDASLSIGQAWYALHYKNVTNQ